MVASQYSNNKGGDHIWGRILKLWGSNTYRGYCKLNVLHSYSKTKHYVTL